MNLIVNFATSYFDIEAKRESKTFYRLFALLKFHYKIFYITNYYIECPSSNALVFNDRVFSRFLVEVIFFTKIPRQLIVVRKDIITLIIFNILVLRSHVIFARLEKNEGRAISFLT